MLKTLGFVVVGLMPLLGSGCARSSSDHEPEAYEVSGTVTLDGQPLEQGGILFKLPDDRLPPASATIEDGEFSLKTRAGLSRVEIRSPREGPNATQRMSRFVESIPDRYNQKSTLTADVVPAGPNRFEFRLQSGKR
jgi:hypothetical protein